MIYTIENDYLKAQVSSLGATLMSLIDKESGTDLVLGFDKETDYLKYSDAHLGATVGRNANRIANGRFTISAQEYQLTINNGPNSLHSSSADTAFRTWEIRERNKDFITFCLFDRAGNGGFPGNMDVSTSYRLKENTLEIKFNGSCDEDTIFNFTNHSYFNLDGGTKDILDHELKVNTDRFALNDDDTMATDKIYPVDGTAFDFREFHKIKDNLSISSFNLSAGGIDHNFVFETLAEKELCQLRNDEFCLKVTSDLPGLQLYSSNFLGDIIGKNGMEYHKFHGLAIEPQYYPNGINYQGLLKPILKKGEKVSHFIRYTIEKRKDNE